MTKRKTLLFVGLCLIASAVMAQHTLESIYVNVTLHQDGTASVIELRKVQVSDQGTEGYITFNDMDDVEVCDIRVSDEQETPYEVEEEWDINRSRDEKTNRCGYHHTDKGVELCWGLGESGERTYLIQYSLTNFVKAYEDYDGFCHSFYEAANAPAQEALVVIQLEKDSLTRDNAAIWTFGYHGTKGFTDGKCYASPDDAMNNGESIIVLLQLKKGVLDPIVKKEESFAETVKRTALEGSDYDLDDAGLGKNVSERKTREARLAASEDSSDDDDDGVEIFTYLLAIGGVGYLLFIVGRFIYTIVEGQWERHKENKHLRKLLDTLFEGKKYNDLPYYRDLPLDDNLLLSGVTLGTVEAATRYCGRKKLGIKYGLQQLYDAFILRMIYKKNIQLEYAPTNGKPRKLFRISEPVQPKAGTDVTRILEQKYLKASGLDENEAIDHSVMFEAKKKYKGYINDEGIEYYLQKFLFDAAGDDHLLQPDELKKYAKSYALKWRPFATILDILTTETVKEDQLYKEDVQEVVGFLHYLRDFSLAKERNIEETGLWKEYLVYASLYGIADQVRKDMKKVAPDVARLNELVPPEEMLNEFKPLREAIASGVIYAHSYQTPQESASIAARERERERSSGGSGRSSFRGGGGHTGGGGSGFR